MRDRRPVEPGPRRHAGEALASTDWHLFGLLLRLQHRNPIRLALSSYQLFMYHQQVNGTAEKTYKLVGAARRSEDRRLRLLA